ncbi:site-2 protease family protein [Candidatus Saccharibacteria bacterium]|nr:site-2 protease family protein [Candidatus Saccharibacteria bacterium]
MNIFFGIIIGLIVLMTLVTAHEFGHFIMAKRNGVKVEEFGICFPPRIAAWLHVQDKTGKWHWQRLPKSEWGKPQKSLVFSLNLLPIGGFCSMHGESDDDKRPHTFGSATFWQKTKILFGGVAMNWLVAFILLTVLGFVGMPQAVPDQFYIGSDTEVTKNSYVLVTGVLDGTPAAAAGFASGDEIISISTAGQNSDSASEQAREERSSSPVASAALSDNSGDKTEVDTTSDIVNFNDAHAGEEVFYTVESADHETRTIPVVLNSAESGIKLGIQMGQGGYNTYKATWSAPIMAAVTTVQLTGETYRGLWHMASSFFSGVFRQFSPDAETRAEGRQSIGAAGEGISGPVGILGNYFPAVVAGGITHILYLAAIISVSLACMNVLPIPALDGGRWFLIALFRLRKKTLTKETEAKIVSRAFVVLLALIILVTILDITRLFR